jgi:hypothetical protein
MLTGGQYVRSLFLANAKHYVRTGRAGTKDIQTAPPSWLLPALTLNTEDAWVGGPIPDPDNSAEQVIPIARRFGQGTLKNAWAGALIAFTRLEAAYQQTESASGIGLFTSDGTALLLAIPEARVRAAEGSNIAGSEMFQQAARGGDSGVVEAIGPFSGAARRRSPTGMGGGAAPCCWAPGLPCSWS